MSQKLYAITERRFGAYPNATDKKASFQKRGFHYDLRNEYGEIVHTSQSLKGLRTLQAKYNTSKVLG